LEIPVSEPVPPDYSQQEWRDNNPNYPLSALREKHIEAGIAADEAFTLAVEEWLNDNKAALSSGGKILESELPESVVTASGTTGKGALPVGESSSKAIWLSVGEDGTAFVADSSNALGVIYRKAPIIDVTAPPYHAGKEGNTALGNWEAVTAAITAAEAISGGAIIYFPAVSGGILKISKGLKYALNKNIHFVGSWQNCKIELSEDLSFGQHVFEGQSESESGGGFIHWFEHLNIKGHAHWPGSPTGGELAAYAPSYAMGFEAISSCRYRDCTAESLYAGWDLRGNHQRFYGCTAGSCFYGVYLGPNTKNPSYGNQVFTDLEVIGCTFAGIGVHPDNFLSGVPLSGICSFGRSPHCFFKEGPAGKNAVSFSSLLTQCLYTEYYGNAFMYDENTTVGSTLAPVDGACGAALNELALSTESSERAGNAQYLTVTATGGTYTLTVPSQVGPPAMIGGTTAAIAWNATNAEIESKIKAVLSSGSVVATPVEGKKQILLLKQASLVAGTEITIEPAGLTGGTATLSAPFVDPASGPLVRPVNSQKITVEKATGGTWELTVNVEGVEKTVTLPYNVSEAALRIALRELSNVTPWGVIVAPTSGPYYLSFNGSLLNKTVTLTANASGLTGTSPAVKIEAGPTAAQALRHNEYSIDIGSTRTFEIAGEGTVEIGSKGFMRAKETGGSLTIRGDVAQSLIANTAIQEGKKILFESPQVGNYIHTLYGQAGTFVIRNVTGPITRGQLLASSGERDQCVIYPAESSKGALARAHAGFANATIAGAEAKYILVCQSAPGRGFSVPYDAEGEPAANKYLKPSTKTAGEVTACTEASDHIVGAALIKGSGGSVVCAPIGCV
jgi:hypothetical protein